MEQNGDQGGARFQCSPYGEKILSLSTYMYVWIYINISIPICSCMFVDISLCMHVSTDMHDVTLSAFVYPLINSYSIHQYNFE